VQDILAGTGYDNAMGYEPTGMYLIAEMNNNDMMEPGKGYWVHVPSDIVWVVDNSAEPEPKQFSASSSDFEIYSYRYSDGGITLGLLDNMLEEKISFWRPGVSYSLRAI